MFAEIDIDVLKIQEQMWLKINKKNLRTASLNSTFTGSFKKSVLKNKVHLTPFYSRIMADDLFVEAIYAFDCFFFNGKPWQLLMQHYNLNCCNNPCCKQCSARFRSLKKQR